MCPKRVVRLKDFSRACTNCRVRTLCLPGQIPQVEVERLDLLVRQHPPLQRGVTLYMPGDPVTALYAVRAGTLKSVSASKAAREQVNGFYFPGDILGFDSITDGRHHTGAVALETTSVCELAHSQLDEIARDIPSLNHQLIRIMSRELGAKDSINRVLASGNSEQKLAGFLLNIGARHELRGYSSTEFKLSMSRRDIASYLGLANATVSRVMTRFQESELVAVRRNAVRILRPKALSDMTDWVQRFETDTDDQIPRG